MKIWIFIILLFFTLLIASGNSTAGISSTATASTIGKKGREYAVLIGGRNGEMFSSVEAWFPLPHVPCRAPPTIPALPQAVQGLSAAVLGNMIISCGGYNNGAVFGLNQCYSYTLGSSRVSWDPAPSMIHGRDSFTLTSFNNFLLLTGGADGSGTLSSVEVYIGRRWSEVVDWKLTSARAGHCAVKYGDSKLVLTGGWPDTYTLVEQLDSTTGEWTKMPSMNYGRWAHSCISFKDDIIVAGGIYSGYVDSAERFSSATGNWEDLPRLNTARYYHSMGVLKGYPTVMGGYDRVDNRGSYLVSTEYFNGTQWVFGKQLQNSRHEHGAVVLTCD